MKTSKISSVSSSRIHNSYVERSKTVSKATTVEAVEPISKANNQTSYSSGAYLIYSDAFYESLNNLREEFEKYYLDHKQLGEAISNYKEDNNLYNLKKVISKYNKTIKSLTSLDKSLGTQHAIIIKNTLDSYRCDLKILGIDISENYQMIVNEYNFSRFEESEDKITSVDTFLKGLILILYKEFRNIRFYKEHMEYSEDISGYITGILFDDLS